MSKRDEMFLLFSGTLFCVLVGFIVGVRITEIKHENEIRHASNMINDCHKLIARE